MDRDSSTADQERDKLRGRLMIATAAILWSSSGFFGKLELFDVWPQESRGIQMAFWRALFGGLLILPLVRRPHWRWELVPMGCAFTGMTWGYLTAYAFTTAANAIWLQSTAPWWVFLIAVTWFREPAARPDVVTFVCGVAGVSVILWNGLADELNPGVVYGLGSAVCYAAVVLMLRRMRGENPAWLVVVNQFMSALLMLPGVIAVGVWPTSAQLITLAGFGFFQLALPYVLFTWGLRHVSGVEATGIALIEPIILPMWAFLTRGEEPAWYTILGASIILMGLVVRYTLMRSGVAPAAAT